MSETPGVPGAAPNEARPPGPFDANGRRVAVPARADAPVYASPDAPVYASPDAPVYASPGAPARVPGTSAPGTRPVGPPRGRAATASGSIPMGWSQNSGAIPIARTASPSDTGALTLTGGIALGLVGRRKKPTVSGFDPVVRGRGLARLSRRPQPTTASELQRATVRWCVTLWVIVLLFQRFQLPGQPIAILLPASLAWCVYGLIRGVVEIEPHRVTWWVAVAGISALVVPLQYATVHDPIVSLTSWGLLLTTWLVFVFRLRDRRRATFMLVLRGVVKASLWLAVLIVVMMASQLVIPYQDWVAKIFPSNILLQGFVITYPIKYGSAFYKGNGWIGLEPSVVSFQLGVGLVAALLIRATMPVVLVLGVGILCTTAGSGMIVALVGGMFVLFSSMRWALARYSLLLPPAIAFLFTPWAAPILARTTEGTGQQSSTGLRAVQPYQVLWPEWMQDPMSVVFGRGPGSSQTLVMETHILGLLVPSPVKLFFDYGLVGGIGLAAFLLFMYLGGPSRAMAVTLGFSLWLLQPGTTTIVFVIAVPFLVTWWTPRTRAPIENDVVPSPNATIVPPPGGRRPEVPA